MRNFTIDFLEIFSRVATDCNLDSSTVRYCLHRLRKEGLKFWTVTLPKLAKAVLTSIEAGCFDQKLITAIAWQGRSLRYFRSLLKGIFCLQTGKLLLSPNPDSLASLRQLCEYTYKLALDFDPTALAKAEQKYEQIQKRVAELQFDITWRETLRKNAETHYPSLFKCSPDYILAAGPRFGPGSFATGGKRMAVPFYEWKQLPDEVIGTCTEVFRPYSGYFKPYPGAPVRVNLVQGNSTAEVLFVPKDSRGPRVISKEPPHTIKPQMAFFAFMSSALETESSKRINFIDQTLNQRLALESSITRENATLDLKDASDSVSHRLVREIFRNSPGVSWFLRNCRSTSYKLPSGKTGTMHALAGMGSGLTFPLLAFLVHLSVCSRVSSTLRIPYKDVALRVYVYGDDLIVPSRWYQLAIDGLTSSGLLVNFEKSYVKGPFRESCGGDYLSGKACMPVRLKLANASLPSNKGTASLRLSLRDCNESNFVVALVKHTHELRISQLHKTAEYYETLLEKVVPMPFVGQGSPLLGRYTDDPLLIVKQGTADGSGTSFIKACMPLPKNHYSSQVCPYKHLAEFIGRTYSTDLGRSLSKAFGEIPIPRRLRLIFRKVSTVLALETRPAMKICL